MGCKFLFQPIRENIKPHFWLLFFPIWKWSLQMWKVNFAVTSVDIYYFKNPKEGQNVHMKQSGKICMHAYYVHACMHARMCAHTHTHTLTHTHANTYTHHKVASNTPEWVVTVNHEFAKQCVIISLQGTSCVISTLDLRNHVTHSSIGLCIQFILAG